MDAKRSELAAKFSEVLAEGNEAWSLGNIDVDDLCVHLWDKGFIERMVNLAKLAFDLKHGDMQVPGGGGPITVPPETDKKIKVVLEFPNTPTIAHALVAMDFGGVWLCGNRRQEQTDIEGGVTYTQKDDTAPDGQMDLGDVQQESEGDGEPQSAAKKPTPWYLDPTLGEGDSCLDPFNQGFQAKAVGKDADVNPYETDSDNADRWARGWVTAKNLEDPFGFWKCSGGKCGIVANFKGDQDDVFKCPKCGGDMEAHTPWYVDVDAEDPPFVKGYQSGLNGLRKIDNPYEPDKTGGGKPKKKQETEDGLAWQEWLNGHAPAVACGGKWWLDADCPFEADRMGVRAQREGETIEANPFVEDGEQSEEHAMWNQHFVAALQEAHGASGRPEETQAEAEPEADAEAGEDEAAADDADNEPEPEGEGDEGDDSSTVPDGGQSF